MIVVPCDNVRHAWQRDAFSVKAGRAQIRHVPDIRYREPEMHVIREERLSAGGVGACDDPVVRTKCRRVPAVPDGR